RSPLNFVVRVVHGLSPILQLAQPAPHPQLAARVDAGYAALTQPDQRDGVATVEKLGAHSAGTTLAIGFHAAQRADHGDLLATLAVDRTLRAGACDFVGQLLGVALLRVLREPTGKPAQIPMGPHGHS